MLQALTTPVMKSVVVGGVLLGLGVFGALRTHGSCDSVTRRLVLHAVEEPRSIYLTAWRDGDLLVTMDGEELRPITITIRAKIYGCRVLGTETLTPMDERTYHYDYSETVLSCEPGAQIRKTPRTGTVTVAAP
ncbi:MAG: hypothetical protein H0X17_17715 [Deltaproteobacteria bacterium]|nr:hypothetical protein [Deltaproteobacteria bacterium]